jgi:hypothetical protein
LAVFGLKDESDEVFVEALKEQASEEEWHE